MPWSLLNSQRANIICPSPLHTFPNIEWPVPPRNFSRIGCESSKFISFIMTTSKVRKFKHIFNDATPTSGLPAQIQSSLLQVGMRVRKSVNQGYKTNLALGLAGEENKDVMQRKDKWWSFNDILEDAEVRSSNDKRVPNGLNIFASGQGFVSSQDSTSTASATSLPTSPSRKRAHFDMDDGLEPAANGDLMEAASTHLRPIAQPRTRKRHSASNSDCTVMFRNTDRIVFDFEEATFLDQEAFRR